MLRDLVQVVTLVINLLSIVVIVRKMTRRNWRVWLPFAMIVTLTIGFYVAVLLNIGLGIAYGEASSMLRVTTSLTLLFYVFYMPPARGKL